MAKRILVILGHPAREWPSFCAALAEAYMAATQAAGHETRHIFIAALRFDPILHEGYKGDQKAEPDIVATQEAIAWAEHLVFVYPLWEFMIPALLKGFMERTFTPGFAYSMEAKNPFKCGMLKGKSARLIQTMGMPALIYRLFFGAHGAKAFQDMLKFAGIRPVRLTCLGMIEAGEGIRKSCLEKTKALGREAA